MALRITDECLNCGACEVECPNTAIYEGGANWKYSDGTNLKGIVKGLNGDLIDTEKTNKAIEHEFYYIVEEKCTECLTFTSEPQCIAVCPVESYKTSKVETEQQLLEKIDWLFKEKTPYQDILVSYKKPKKNDSCGCHTTNDSKTIDEIKPKNFWQRIFRKK